MPRADAATYFILDGHQGRDPVDGWRAAQHTSIGIGPDALQLAAMPSPPVPLKDGSGTFGGIENPTGVAVDAGGIVYVSDSKTHLIYKIVRRDGLELRAKFYSVSSGPFAKDWFVYVPMVNRLERWPNAVSRRNGNFSEVEVICETVWNETIARRELLSFINTPQGMATAKGCCDDHAVTTSAEKGCCNHQPVTNSVVTILKEWQDVYPADFPHGDLCKSDIRYLPCLGGKGTEPRQFNEPRGLTITGAGNLYVADSRNHRVQAFTLNGLLLKAVWGKRAGAADVSVTSSPTCEPLIENSIRFGQPIAGSLPGQFNEPWDVAGDCDGNVFIADKNNHRVQKWDCRTRRFAVIDGTVLGGNFFKVLYGPAERDRFVFIPARRRLERWPHSLGHDPVNIGEVTILSEDVRSVEDARRLILDSIHATGATDMLVEWNTVYPKPLADFPQPEEPFASPTHLAIDRAGRVYVVDEQKDYVKILDNEGRVLGRVEFADQVAGEFKPTSVAIGPAGELLLSGTNGVHSFSTPEGHCNYGGCHAALGNPCTGMAVDADGNPIAVGPQIGVAKLPAPLGFLKEGTYISQPLDSEIERCQWHRMRLDLVGGVPTGTSVSVQTYSSADMQTIDQILALEEEDWETNQTNANDFLILSEPGRFLWLRITLRGNGVDTPVIRNLKVYFPRITYLEYLPAVYQADPVSKDFLERFLSIFEATNASIEEKIERFSEYLDADGVPQDFLSWLAGWVDMAFDASWSGETRRRLLRNSPELYRTRGTPAGMKLLLRLALGIEARILEHFRVRRWLFLSAQSPLCDRSELWGNCIVNRLQLDEYSTIGDFALIGTGDPVRDPFFVSAHKFSVFVDRALIKSDVFERMLRYLIESAKPAHTQYTLEKIEPRFRVGIQATVGLDTQIGVYPKMVLSQCSTLGYDTLLGCDSEERVPLGMQIGERALVGASAVVG